MGGLASPVACQDAQAVDAERLLADLSVLANDSMAGRGTGTPGAARARSFLAKALAEAGATPVGDAWTHPFRWAGGARVGVNVLAMVRGRGDDDGVIVLTAHYDHLGIRDGTVYNGADDNASGSAALLEVARQVAQVPLEHTLLLALVDAEEQGFQGSRAIVSDPPVPIETVMLNVNLDMVSRTDGTLWAGGAYHTPELKPILEAVAASAPVRLRLGHDRPDAPEGDDWTTSSDHAPFHQVGIPFVYFGVEDHADYHEPTDDFERVDPAEFAAAVRTILDAMRRLDAALPFGPPGAAP